jgi:hypothetical protein
LFSTEPLFGAALFFILFSVAAGVSRLKLKNKFQQDPPTSARMKNNFNKARQHPPAQFACHQSEPTFVAIFP